MIFLTRKTIINKWGANVGVALAAVVMTTMAAGCTYPGDTSGFKAEKIPSKEQINRQIAEVRANPKLPESVKAMALKKLQKDLETAR
jgi:hypothetical protein